ncbi:MAG: hypothetical protein WHX52_02565 [Anaerolineae bacterium]
MQKSSTEQKVYRYPWARALMIVVLYGAMLVFLWHFPTPGGRAFFQTLFRGFLYILAGLALIGVTIVFFLFFPIPPVPEKMKKELLDEAPVDDDQDNFDGEVLPARALMVPAFKSPEVEPRVWETLYAFERDYQLEGDILADAYTGIIAVTEDDEEETEYILDEIRSRLKAAGIAFRNPR